MPNKKTFIFKKFKNIKTEKGENRENENHQYAKSEILAESERPSESRREAKSECAWYSTHNNDDDTHSTDFDSPALYAALLDTLNEPRFRYTNGEHYFERNLSSFHSF